MSANNELFYKIAISSCIISIISIVFMISTLPLLYNKINADLYEIEARANVYEFKSNKLWNDMKTAEYTKGKQGLLFFSRKRRSPWDSGTICQGCTQLSCPQGLSGQAGESGDDGMPGMPGNPGKAGEDGLDVELAPDDEMPCTICPAGPPGPRGPQGERGMPGLYGESGEQGEIGRLGLTGDRGPRGGHGHQGKKGPTGAPGHPGKVIIAGTGVKGPKGPPGPQGPMGKQGPGGRGAKEAGHPGSPGEPGEAGAIGEIGKVGEVGPYGPPGEPGMPAAYCASDCGVSHIIAPMKKPTESDIEYAKHAPAGFDDNNAGGDGDYYTRHLRPSGGYKVVYFQ